MWRDELTGRIQKFRRKRARMQGQFDPDSSLDLDFDASEAETEELASLIGGQVIRFGDPNQELESGADSATEADSTLEAAPELASDDEMRVLSGAAVQAGEISLHPSSVAREPVEILLDSRAPSAPVAARAGISPQHLMSRRLNAGLVDALVLLIGGGVFGGIFLGFGLKSARLSASPVTLGASGLAAACLAILYFGLSVAFSGATPGMSWLGLEVRNLDGNAPTKKEAWTRAVCYLVSASALCLGFLWALLDSDGLTWHDLMSGTCIVEREK